MTVTPQARYRILETIGRGGMGEVCLAADTLLDRHVALKFVAATHADGGNALARLLSEAKAAAALDHPFICKIYEVTELDGRPCIVMEYVRGDTLEMRLRRGPVEAAEVMRLGEEIAEALASAHKRRLIHRDLKPANVIVTEEGHIKVMDFGLAIHVPAAAAHGAPVESGGANTAVGTPAYMAPEQIRGDAVDQRSDIFSCGIVLYELLSGAHPFRCLGLDATLAAILHDDPGDLHEQSPRVPKPLAALVGRMLAKSPAARHQSFGEVRRELRRLASELSTTAAAAAPGSIPVEPAVGDGGRLVGREAEYEELVRSVRQAMSGRGRLVLLSGEAGAGKTRLAEEVLRAARTLGCLTLVGRANEQAGTAPLNAFVEALEDAERLLPAPVFRDVLGKTAPELARLMPELHRLFPDMPPPIELPPDLRQRFIFSNVREFLVRCSRVMPLVLLLDDLHHADESTWQLTQALAPHLAKLPILIVGAYREIEPAPEPAFGGVVNTLLRRMRGQRTAPPLDRHPVTQAVDQLLSQHLTRVIPLTPLGEDAVGALLASLARRDPPPDVTQKFMDDTGGNPLFVEELFRHLHEESRLFDAAGRWRRARELDRTDVPAGIRPLIARRLRRVSRKAHETLTTAAVIGLHFDLDLLDAIADVHGEALAGALDEGERAHLVKGPSGRTETRWRFTNQLILQSLAGELPQARRERLHLHIADAMARVHAGAPSFMSDMAHHLYCAGRAADSSRTAQALLAAADAAHAVYATDDAILQYRRALEVVEETRGMEAEKVRIQERLADVLALTGDRTAALEHLSRVIAVHERGRNRADQARALRKVGALHWQSGDRQRATDCYTQALAALDGEADDIERAHLYQELGLAAFRNGNNREAIEWAERAVSAAQTASADPSRTAERRRHAAAAVAQATNTLGAALARSGRLDAAREHMERSVAVAEEHGLLDVVCRGYANLGVLYGMLEPRRAIEVSKAGLDLATRIGAASLQSYIYANLAAAYCALTDRCETEGLVAARTAAELDRALGQLDHLAVPLIVMAQIHQCQGELQQAQEAYREALDLAARAGEPQLLFPCYDGLATIYLDRGDRTRAEEFMQKARELCERTGTDPDTLVVLPFLC